MIDRHTRILLHRDILSELPNAPEKETPLQLLVHWKKGALLSLPFNRTALSLLKRSVALLFEPNILFIFAESGEADWCPAPGKI